MKNKEQIIEQFRKVKKLGFVKSNRKNNTGIGKTFEDYIGVVENNLDEPDLLGYEIKAHREEASSYVTLFTKSPNFPTKANAYLNSNFGTPYEENPLLNKLHTSMFASKFNTYGGKYSFKLINDRAAQVIKIGVYDIETKELINSNVGYTYDCLSKILERKLKNLFYVSAEREYRGEDEYFYFNKAEIYTNPSLEKFLDLLDKGLIMYDIRIGSYQSGKNYGKPHDHGSGFRIIESNIKLLFDTHESVE
ncbi:MvaI/BcnI family restriction endonuclease [Parabacteroides merdae]|uniref:MvaI/BcnI family restriction endonuclease n=1 Tax=Parabacteroides merdae TaxID=46503 RepID=UPI003F9C8A63